MLDEQTSKNYRFDDILDLFDDRHPAQTVVLLWRLLAEAGFPPVPLENARPGDPKSGKRPSALNWPVEARRLADDGTPWPPWCNRDSSYVDELNVGIAAHGLRIVDIDIDDEQRADAAQEMAELILGPCPAVRRRDGTGRRAMLYRSADGEPEKKVRKNIAADEKVEVLGKGQQLVSFGRHWSGAEQWWKGVPGFEVRREDLPEATEAQVDEFLDAVAEMIGADPPAPEREFVLDFSGSGRAPPPNGLPALTEEDIGAALDLIHTYHDRDDWLRIGAAVHAWDCGGTGFGLWDRWSRQSGKYRAADAWATWRSLNGMSRIGVGTLMWAARQTDPAFNWPSLVGWSRPPDRIPTEDLFDCVDDDQEAGGGDRPEPTPEPEAPQADPSPRRTFRIMRCQDVINLPPPRFMVPGLVIEDTVGLFYGPSQSFKSFVVLDIALSLACGADWCGEPLRQRPVCYIAAEGAGGMGMRVRGWLRDRGREGEDPPFLLIPQPVNLADARQMRDLERDLQAEARGLGEAFGLVVFDTVAACASGMDENSSREVGAAIGRKVDLRRALGAEGQPCTVLGVHHTGKDEERGMRGSGAFGNNVDTVVRVERAEKSLHCQTQVEKQKDSPIHLTRRFTAHPVAWERDGETVETLAIRQRDERERAIQGMDEEAKMRREIAAALELGEPVSKAALCDKLGWNRGRVYGRIDAAVPTEAGAFSHDGRHGRVRLFRDAKDRVVMVAAAAPH